MLADPDESVCGSAAYTLGEVGLGEPEVLTALQAACEQPDEQVSTAAQRALLTVRRGPQQWDAD